MKACTTTIISFIIAATSSWADDDDWATIDTGPFTFLAPTTLVAKSVQGIDSLVGKYTNQTIILSYDFGLSSDPLRRRFERDKLPGYEEQNLIIDGKKAVIVAFPGPIREWSHQYTKSIHFTDVGDGRNKLTVSASGKTTNDLVTLQRVFESIRIKERLSQPAGGAYVSPGAGDPSAHP
jgi:hypothetical protein